ncbi:tumor suppressor candidate 3 isoform X2 [Melitaea cinxia]|uniref:tumor suppressor candidate 3 isoform X1 n=1 Tax=Melitaea cinxia TaxID=113334 RepID=UPI001E271C09|nr:tumor suppressor candidate 3 isoform X1 [Melitaea cinxia]XP_045459795.1 tumor suppressor candidate 3 isoform X2 [Melitaea cinxia]
MKYKTLLCLTAILTYCNIDAQSRTKGLEEKVQQLADISAKQSIIALNFNKFKEYVKSPPRDYSFIVMFTAMAPSRRCAICQHVYDEYLVVANSFRLSPSFSDKLFFGLVDFDEGSDVFQMLRLNTAPVIMHFPAKGKPKPADSMDFERTGIHAEAIIKWIQDRTDIQIRVFRPPNYSGVILIAMLLVLITGFLYLRRNNLDFLYNKQMWAVIAIFFCFSMVSGQMWNQIRGPPFFHRTKNGPVYINGGSHGQFVLESYIVAALNGAVVVGMIFMIEAAGGVKGTDIHRAQEGKRRRFQFVVGLVLVCVFFSLLLSIFRSKTQGYPYSFLFK